MNSVQTADIHNKELNKRISFDFTKFWGGGSFLTQHKLTDILTITQDAMMPLSSFPSLPFILRRLISFHSLTLGIFQIVHLSL